YAPLFQKLERPFLLYLALLLHDVGKPDGHGNHSEVSAELAMRVAKRLGLDGASTHTLRLVIEHHLLMASTSQRRDLDDPAVIRKVAKQVQSPETVVMLTLHTFADSLATSDKLWNGFKDSLLWSLHAKVLEAMTGGTEFVRAEEKQRELLMEEVRREMPERLSGEELQAHFSALQPRYFQIHSARDVLDDLVLAHRFMRLQISDEENPLAPVFNWQNHPDRACNEVKICTWDRAGLFRKITGSLSSVGLNILSAQIFTRNDGIVLDKFSVNDARTGSLAGPEQRENFEKVIHKALTGDDVDFPALIARQKITRPAYQAYTGERIPTRIHFDNDSSDTRTVIEIETEDRIGLLYTISEALSALELDVSGAKIATEKGAAIDSFYLREFDGEKVVAPERHRAIERGLRHAIGGVDAG
ncbi:MAG: HD domain-containing protein, partial [Limisphaerales bacterium]